MKHSFIKTMLVAITALFAQNLAAQTPKVKFPDFVKNLSAYENKTVIIMRARVDQNYAIRKSDGTVENLVGLSGKAKRLKDKKLPEPNCQYTNGFTEIRIQHFRYCVKMSDALHAKYQKQLERSSSLNPTYDFILSGSADKGYIVEAFSSLRPGQWTR